MRGWNVLVMLPPRVSGEQFERYNYQQLNPYGKYNGQGGQSNSNYAVTVNNSVNSKVGGSEYREEYYK